VLDVVCHRREADFDHCTGHQAHQDTRGPEDTELDRCDGVLAVSIGAASSLPMSTALASGSTLLHTGGELSKGLGAMRLERTGTQSSDEAPSMM
jgi:hypothetical protein